jgi:hypothetical protein
MSAAWASKILEMQTALSHCRPMEHSRKRRSTLKMLLLAAGLAVVTEVLFLIGFDMLPRGSNRVFDFLDRFHEPSARLVAHLMPDYFEYPEETTSGQEFLAVIILYGLPLLQWFCIFLPTIWAFRGLPQFIQNGIQAHRRKMTL